MGSKLILSLAISIISISTYGQEIFKQLEYEDIKLIDGSTISSADLENKVIVVNLWGTWCKPCLKELPDLNELYEKYNDEEGVIFLAIAHPQMDTPEKLTKFLETKRFDFKHIIPAEQSIFFSLTGTIVFPTTVIYNAKGELKKKFVDTLNEKELNKITTILDKLIEERKI